MDLNELRRFIRKKDYGLTLHAVEERLRKNLSNQQVEEVIMNGTVAKTEPDEKTSGEFQKLTIDWRSLRIVVKNSEPPVIISIRVKT